MSYQAILYEKADRIARITLNRPEKLNALSTQLRVELIDAVTESARLKRWVDVRSETTSKGGKPWMLSA